MSEQRLAGYEMDERLTGRSRRNCMDARQGQEAMHPRGCRIGKRLELRLDDVVD